jgi:hypothetical protein
MTSMGSTTTAWLWSDVALIRPARDARRFLDTVSEPAPARTVDLRSVTGEIVRITVFEEPLGWFWRLVENAKVLLALPPGWNSHAAAAVPARSIVTLLNMLEGLTDATPFPSITPLSSGGIQVEWHESDIEVEAVIDETGEASIWYDDSRAGVQDEFTERESFPRFRELVAELTRRT